MRPRCPGHPGSAKKISMSCAFEIDFQLENSFPQSKVIDLIRYSITIIALIDLRSSISL